MIDSTSLFFFTDALKCVVWGGRALVIGFAGGGIEKVRGVTSRKPNLAQLCRKLPLNLVLLKNVSVIGTYWGSYQSTTRHLSPFTRQV